MAREIHTHDQLVSAVNRRKRAFTARDLGVRVDKLRQLEAEGLVVEVGHETTGKAGRPQIIFQNAARAAEAQAGQQPDPDPTSLSRTGKLQREATEAQ